MINHAKLGEWAEVAKIAEQRYRPSFDRNPARYDNSYAKFRFEISARHLFVLCPIDRCSWSTSWLSSLLEGDKRTFALLLG